MRELSAADALRPRPSWSAMLKRGARKRCPRCGGGGLFRGWFRMADRCPGCGYRFEREPGFFVGAYFVNFAVTEGVLAVVMVVFLFVRSAGSGASLVPWLLGGLVVAVVAPVIFYPFSRTIWSAIDLAMAPMELDEIADAAESSGGGESGDRESLGGGDGGSR